MSWESGESDKQAGEACLPCIARHRGVRDRAGLRLDWEILLLFSEKGQDRRQVLDRGS